MVTTIKRPMGSWPAKRGEGQVHQWLKDHIDYMNDDCLIFPFSRHPTGYGSFGHLGEMHYAHRFMCELAHGPAPEDKPHAAHSCGKGHEGCVNPRHLDWASISQNLLDRRRHGTVDHGSRGAPKLNEEQIATIRRLKGIKTQQELADMYGVKRPAIQYWQKHDRPLTRLVQRPDAIQRRERDSRRRSS